MRLQKSNQNISLNDNFLSMPKPQTSNNELSTLMRLKHEVIIADLQKVFHSIGYLEEPDEKPGLEINSDLLPRTK